ncbi:MAG: hypothetical protein P8Q97_06620 [Myxococcota bacterium]|jgi:hypothetical protein|nr:hypothetical protein [Myxococcota bacterium]
MERQQILYLWLAEGALDTPTIGWAFHDGAKGQGPSLPATEPPYATGLGALEDGWFLIQSARPPQPDLGDGHGISYLPNEFVFERRITID